MSLEGILRSSVYQTVVQSDGYCDQPYRVTLFPTDVCEVGNCNYDAGTNTYAQILCQDYLPNPLGDFATLNDWIGQIECDTKSKYPTMIFYAINTCNSIMKDGKFYGAKVYPSPDKSGFITSDVYAGADCKGTVMNTALIPTSVCISNVRYEYFPKVDPKQANTYSIAEPSPQPDFMSQFASPSITNGPSQPDPAVRNASLNLVTLDRDGVRLPFGAIKIDFDSHIYLSDKKTNSTASVKDKYVLQRYGNSVFPSMTVMAQQTISLTCDGVEYSGSFNPNTTSFPPEAYMIVPAYTDPANYLVSSTYNEIQPSQTLFTNQLVILYGGRYVYEWTNETVCTVTFGSNGDYFLSSKSNYPIHGSLMVQMSNFPCSYDDLTALELIGNEIYTYGKGITNWQQLGVLQKMVESFAIRPSFLGCRNTLKDWLSLQYVPKSTADSQVSLGCKYAYNSFEWFTDPVCNVQLREKKCSNTINPPANEWITPNETYLATCTNPGRVSALLGEYDFANKYENEPFFDAQKRYEFLIKPFLNCTDQVNYQVCESDNDCVHSGKCGPNGYCSNWDDESASLIRCFLSRADRSVLLEVGRTLSLSTVSDRFEYLVQKFTKKFNDLAYIDNCVGPASKPYKKSVSWKLNEDGTVTRSVKIGDAEGCLRQQGCNFQPNSRTNANYCLRDRSDGYCAICENEVCTTITKAPLCQSFGISATDCDSLGGKSSFGKVCTYENRTTEDTCFGAKSCKYINNKKLCAIRSVCIDPTVLTQVECASKSFYNWDPDFQTCINQSVMDLKSCTSLSNHTFVPNISFQPGQYTTKKDCEAAEVCNGDSLFQSDELSNCEAKGRCSVKCDKCHSNRFPSGVCVAEVSTAASCYLDNGFWDRSTCFLPQIPLGKCSTTNFNSGANATWLSCNGLNSTTCTSNSRSKNLLDCFWKPDSFCWTQRDCKKNGWCDDFEFAQNGTSSCIYPPGTDTGCKAREFKARNGWCVKMNQLTKNNCYISGGTWWTKAQSSQGCIGYGYQCTFTDGVTNYFDLNSCENCDGVSRTIYNWNEPVWNPGQKIVPVWKQTDWVSVNKWQSVLDESYVLDVFQSAAAKVVSRSMLNHFNRQYTTNLGIYKRISCDCMTNSKQCLPGFLKGARITCVVDGVSNSVCGGLRVVPDLFPRDVPVLIQANTVSVEPFYYDNLTSNKTYSIFDQNYFEVVRNGNRSIIGQIIGYGKEFNLETYPSKNVTICLSKHPSVVLNLTNYNIYDFVNASNFILNVPMKANVTVIDGQFCAKVPPFIKATYYPILRNESNIVPATWDFGLAKREMIEPTAEILAKFEKVQDRDAPNAPITNSVKSVYQPVGILVLLVSLITWAQ